MTLHGPSPDALAARRTRAAAQLEGAVMFLPEAPETIYSNDVEYPFRPDSNVRYLTGFEEPAAVLLSHHGGPEDGFTLFVRPRDAQSETWTGRRAGLEGAVEQFGADYAHPLETVPTQLRAHLRHAKTLFFGYSRDSSINAAVLAAVQDINAERPRTGRAPLVVRDAMEILADLRIRKTSEEIDLMRRAAEISAAAHTRLFREIRPGDYEYQAAALLEFEFRRHGCTGPAYGSIVAGGDNATVLHYTRNDQILRDGDLALVDAGGEYGGYCADITRTFPVGKSYTKAQAQLYDVVLEAQLAAIDAIKPGVAVEQPHQAALRVLVGGLIRLGLLEGEVDERIKDESFRPFYMHNTSHWLGMDVHDVGEYRVDDQSRVLEPGMVLTVEPGLYIRSDHEAAQDFRGIGIRIEDDVAVTNDGADVLTCGVAKRRDEIEALRAGALA